MRSFTRNILILGCFWLMGYIFFIYYIKPYQVPIVQAADVFSMPTATSAVFYNTGSIAPFFTREIQYWSGSIASWSNMYGVDQNLIATVMQIESCGNPWAVSSAGAMGLFQVMPFHFNSYEDPYNAETNALRGLGYLGKSLNTANGNPRLALAGYNGGIGVISRGELTWASETVRYVTYGYPIYLDAVNGLTASESLEEWYRKYGVNLCKDAASRLGIY